MLPINGLAPGWLYERMAQVNAAVAAWTIKRALRQLQFARPVMINANNPFLGAYLTPQLDLRRAYYYCYDEIGATRWTYRHGPRLEQQLLAQVDGVMASSQALLEVKGAGHAPAQRLLLRNGANVDLFGQAFTEVLPDHAAGPVLGYLGSIDDRIDVDLLLSLMNQWPEARLLMVGRITDASTGDRLGQHPRIELAGPQPPDQLPTWLKRMHLGLIPFVANAFTRYIYPLKINEYLAAGLPVVSTDFSDLSEFTAVAHIAASGPPFLRACQQAWQEDSPAQRKMRRIFAQEQSWRGRALTLTSWLSGQLGRPAAGPSSRIMPVERRPNDCPLLITQLSQLPPTPQHP
jgi:glycosyltransferase involved in cell wall biosynthesis